MYGPCECTFSQHRRPAVHTTHVCTAVVGVFPDGDATEEAAEFKAAAQDMREDFEFGLVTDASLVPEAKGCGSCRGLPSKDFRLCMICRGTCVAMKPFAPDIVASERLGRYFVRTPGPSRRPSWS